MGNLEKWLADLTPVKYCTGEEISTGGSAKHLHTVVEFAHEYVVSNATKWRAKLLEGVNAKLPAKALVFTHDLTYIKFLGYAVKDGQIVHKHNTSDADIETGKRNHVVCLRRKEAIERMKTLRIIPPAHLQAMRELYGSDQQLADMGFTCVDYHNVSYKGWFELANL